MGVRHYVVALFAMGLICAGCGDGESQDSTTSAAVRAPMTKSPPAGVGVNEAARICTHGSKGERAELGGYCQAFAHHPNRLVGVAGSNGKRIVCADGKPLMVRGNEAPPKGLVKTGPPHVVNGVESVEVIKGAVPRCGPTGGGPGGQAVWVPEDVGKGITEAPPGYSKAQSGE